MSKKKAELVEEAAAAGVEDPEDLTVAELKDALTAPTEASVKVENREGQIVVVFGTHVPDEEEASFDEVAAYAISRDDAVQLAADLPTVAQAAVAGAVHRG